MVSVGSLKTPISNKSIRFRRNESYESTPRNESYNSTPSVIATPDFSISSTPPKLTQLSPAIPELSETPSQQLTSSIMSPNSRKRKSRIAYEVFDFIKAYQLNDNDNIEVMTLALKKLNLLDRLDFSKKPSKAGRKELSLEIRECVWKYWHSNSTASTLTSKPAKLRVSEKKKIQNRLNFVDTTSIIQQRNRSFYLSNWFIINITIKEFYVNYIKSHPDMAVSLGTFLSLKPFYVRSATTKDIEMCCCKKHLHARWSIQALIQCAIKQGIDITPVNCYYTFFEYLVDDCEKDALTYINWNCTPSSKTLCDHIISKWDSLTQKIFEQDDGIMTVKFQHFENSDHTLKNGKVVNRLTAVCTDADMKFIISFIFGKLPKFIHHRNQLKNYRSAMGKFRNVFNDTVMIDIDSSENLSIPVKYEPQSLHWSHEQVTIHAGILKVCGEKSYHPYLSADRKHDQHFVQVALEEMLSEVENIPPDSTIIIESDNCAQ